ncbi:radical SAM protein [bacterium]|nr:radical SAM protein [candidate division CSSED10-310 bacterium]
MIGDVTSPDLSWIEPWIQRIRSHVAVRTADNVLIRMPNECFKLNESGARLMHFMLNGGSLGDVLAARNHDPEAVDQINGFFTAVRLMLDHRMCERFQSDAVQRVNYRLGYIDLPILAELAVTHRCNIRCRFCYGSCVCSTRETGSRMHRRTELSTRRFERIIRIIRHDAGVPSMSFTGGEPMLRNDIFRLVRYAAVTMGMRVNLITNGTLITTDTALRLRDSGLASAQVSIESPDPAVHDVLTQVPGSFHRSETGVRALRDAGILVHVHATICSENAQSLQDMPRFVQDLKLDRFSLNMMIPIGRGKGNDLAVRYREMDAIVRPIIERARVAGVTFMWYAPTPICLFNPVALGLGNKGCAACEGLLAIDPDGNILPCSSWPEPLGSLLKTDFRTIWFSDRARTLRMKHAAPEQCTGCSDFAVCQGACPLYFDAFPEDRAEVICRTAGLEMEGLHDVLSHASGISRA